MALTQKVPAVVLTALLAATWAVPAMISSNVPAQVSTVGADEKKTLSTYTGSEVTFDAPAGWSTSLATDSTSVIYTKEKDSQELTLSVVGGSKNFDVTADRILRESSVRGTSASFDGGEIVTAGGFTGKACVAIKPELKAAGPCAVVHKGGTVLAVIATSTDTQDVLDLKGLLDTVQLTKEDDPE